MIENFIETENLFETIILYLGNKIKEPYINDLLHSELIKPLTKLLISNLYPYLITAVIMVSLMFLGIIGTFILLLKK